MKSATPRRWRRSRDAGLLPCTALAKGHLRLRFSGALASTTADQAFSAYGEGGGSSPLGHSSSNRVGSRKTGFSADTGARTSAKGFDQLGPPRRPVGGTYNRAGRSNGW